MNTTTSRPYSISVVMIVKNEAENLKTSLPAIADWVNEIIILDSGSSDESRSIAEQYGAKWHTNTEWNGFGTQRQRAQEYASGDWILALDADEEVSPELRDAILAATSTAPANTVYGIQRLDYVFGKCIDNPYWGVKSHWRLYPSRFRYDDNLVHESVILEEAQTEKLSGFLFHHTAPTPKFWLEKRLSYARAWAQDRHSQGKRISPYKIVLNPLWAFIKQYLLDGRFLQGKYGLIYSLLFVQYTFNKYAILYDMSANKAHKAFENASRDNSKKSALNLSAKQCSLSLVMIVKNEAKHLAECLDSIHDLADEIIILDSGSTDNTKTIAQQYGALIYSSEQWNGFGKQRQHAQSYASSDYILMLDADERVDAELRASILKVLMQPLQIDKVFSVARVNQFCGVEVQKRHWYTDKLARLYANNSFCYSDHEVHESLDQKDAPAEVLKGHLLHLTNDNLHHFLVKNIRYSHDWALANHQKGKNKPFASILLSSWVSFIREYLLRGDIIGGTYGFILAFASLGYTMDKYIMLWIYNNISQKR